MKQVADEKKDNVAKRVTLFTFLVEHDRFNPKEFKRAWIDAIRVYLF